MAERKQQQEQQANKDDGGAAQVQATVDEAEDKGYFGEVPDPTPNENYTLQGVGKGLPTPETDEGARQAAEQRARELARPQRDQ